MAGYVKLHRSIWQDPDFVALTPDAQRLYMLLISQPDITHVGILPLMPARWSRFSTGTSPAQVRAALDELSTAEFVLTDNDTEELLVRSYLIYDEAHKLTNGAKSLLRAYGQVLSRHLRTAIATLLSTVDVTVDSTLALSQQPAASSHEPFPAASSHAEAGGCSDRDPDEDAAAAAIEILIAHKCTTARNPKGLRAKLAKELPKEHKEAIDEYLAGHPHATAVDLAADVLGVPGLTASSTARPPAWYADPYCPFCGGDGIANSAPEGTPATYGPCPCRRTEPWPVQLATVTHLPTTGNATA